MTEDILEKAKSVIEEIRERDRSGKWISSNSADMHAAGILPELIAEVERLRSENRQWDADYKKLQAHYDDLLKAFEASEEFRRAYMNGKYQMYALGNEVITAAVEEFLPCNEGPLDRKFRELVELPRLVAKDTRIKELEAAVVDGRAQYLLFLDCNPDGVAWNFDELSDEDQDRYRKDAITSLEMEEPWALIQLREAREQIKRLEAAFLDSLAARLYYEHYPGVSDAYSWHDYPEDACHSMPKEEFRKKAREALEDIKAGAKDEFMDTTFNLLEFIDAQAAQIEALKKEADCSDIVQALENAGVDMGNSEQCQDIITAIEILGGRIEDMREKLVEERARRICHNPSEDTVGHWHQYEDMLLEEARQQLKAEMVGVDWE